MKINHSAAPIVSIPKTYSRKRGRLRSSPSDLSRSTSIKDPSKTRRNKNMLTAQTLDPIRNLHIEKEDDLHARPTKRLRTRTRRLESPRISKHTASSTSPSTEGPNSASSHGSDKQVGGVADPLPSEPATALTSDLCSPDDETAIQSEPGTSPTRGVKSRLQKENILSHPSSLASPFHIAPPSKTRRATTSKRISETQMVSPKMARRPSVPHTFATTSASFRRRPSGSHALQQKTVLNQDWLFPPSPHFRPSHNPPALDKEDIVPINDSHAYPLFSPQNYSTPLSVRRLPVVTPITPMPLRSIRKVEKFSDGRDTVMNDASSTSATAKGLVEGISSELARKTPGITDNAKCQPRRVVHFPHDSIFSSFDFSSSVADNPLGSLLSGQDLLQRAMTAHKCDPNHTPPRGGAAAELEGEELQNMFSILDLKEPKKISPLHDSGVALDVHGSPGKDDVTEDGVPHLKRKLGSTTMAGRKKVSPHQPRKRPRGLSKRKISAVAVPGGTGITSAPYFTSHTDDEPLMAKDDEDDELLLTSKGWDWVPPALRTLSP